MFYHDKRPLTVLGFIRVVLWNLTLRIFQGYIAVKRKGFLLKSFVQPGFRKESGVKTEKYGCAVVYFTFGERFLCVEINKE